MFSAVDPRNNLQAFRELLLLVTKHRTLTLEMARREISDRYAGQFFGLFWSFGHPLILILVYVFVFRFIFSSRVGGAVAIPMDYSTYLLAGLIPWITFQDAMSKACIAITINANIVKQVIFPTEVLPLKGVIATLFTELVLLGILIVYVLASHRFLPWSYLLIPVLVVLQFLAMTGISYFLAAVGPYFRDIKDFVQVFTVVGLYMAPIFYQPTSMPEAARIILYVNPFSHFIWCFQDAIYFGQFAHPWSWLVVVVLSLAVFSIGYRLFRKLKPMFGNVL
jgi:lipopolysaccharide transport system permease protein